jgi:hypothetical protein
LPSGIPNLQLDGVDLVNFDHFGSELDTYIAANLVPTVTLYSGLKSSLIYLTMRQLLPVADYPMTMILNSS